MSKFSLVDSLKGKHWVIILIIIISSFGIYNGLTSLTEDAISENWQTKDRTLLIDKCLKDAGEISTKYPGLLSEYCSCSILKIQDQFTKREYFEISSEPVNSQLDKLYPVIESCQAELQTRIKEIEDPE